MLGENFLLVLLIALVLMNIAGIAIPLWHAKSHAHDVGNATHVESCVITVKIREGLWQRLCYEVRGAECVEDVQEWCDNLDGQDFMPYVFSLEMAGDLFLIASIIAIVRSKVRGREFNMEMIGTLIGCACILIMLGVLVFAMADGGEIGFEATDLHLSWGLCVGSGGLAGFLCLCACCLSQWSNSRYSNYFPITDDYPMTHHPITHEPTHPPITHHSDEELIAI